MLIFGTSTPGAVGVALRCSVYGPIRLPTTTGGFEPSTISAATSTNRPAMPATSARPAGVEGRLNGPDAGLETVTTAAGAVALAVAAFRPGALTVSENARPLGARLWYVNVDTEPTELATLAYAACSADESATANVLPPVAAVSWS